MLLAAAPALGAFPGTNPGESVRHQHAERPRLRPLRARRRAGPADLHATSSTSSIERFGFAPNGSQLTALYHNPLDPHVQRLSAQNTLAGRNPLGQVSGVSADRAWKYSTGAAERPGRDPRHRHPLEQRRSLRKKVALNRGELPLPRIGASTCAQYDCNGDGAFNVDDYANDPRVSPRPAGDEPERRLASSTPAT